MFLVAFNIFHYGEHPEMTMRMYVLGETAQSLPNTCQRAQHGHDDDDDDDEEEEEEEEQEAGEG